MTTEDRIRERLHDLETTVWVGKAGVESAADELASQLEEREAVKVSFQRSATAGDGTESVAEALADAADAELFETRGRTAVYYRA
jgi:RNA-binding protein